MIETLYWNQPGESRTDRIPLVREIGFMDRSLARHYKMASYATARRGRFAFRRFFDSRRVLRATGAVLGRGQAVRGKGIVKIVIGALVVVGAYAAFKDDIAALWDNLHVKIAEYPQPTKTVWL